MLLPPSPFVPLSAHGHAPHHRLQEATCRLLVLRPLLRRDGSIKVLVPGHARARDYIEATVELLAPELLASNRLLFHDPAAQPVVVADRLWTVDWRWHSSSRPANSHAGPPEVTVLAGARMLGAAHRGAPIHRLEGEQEATTTTTTLPGFDNEFRVPSLCLQAIRVAAWSALDATPGAQPPLAGPCAATGACDLRQLAAVKLEAPQPTLTDTCSPLTLLLATRAATTSRGRAGRHLTNEAALIEALHQRLASWNATAPPCATARLELFAGNETLRDTVATFRAASIVLAVHGGALANLVFSTPASTSVIEIGLPEDAYTMYGASAAALGLHYVRVGGIPANSFARPVTAPVEAVVAAVGQELERVSKFRES